MHARSLIFVAFVLGFAPTTVRGQSRDAKPEDMESRPWTGVQGFNWQAGKPAVKMMHRDKGFAFLTGVQGAMPAWSRVNIALTAEGNWELHGNTHPKILARAVACPWLVDAEWPLQIKVWKTNQPTFPKLIHQRDGFCVLLMVGGRLVGRNDEFRLHVDESGFWRLRARSKSPTTRVQVAVIKSKQAGGFRGESREHLWRHGDKPVRLIHSRDGIAFLSGLTGTFGAPSDYARVTRNEDGYWYLEGRSASKRDITARAMTIQFATGKTTNTDAGLASRKRTWTSADGKFQAIGELVKLVGGRVSLKLKDGKVVEISLDRLSGGDRDFVKELMSRPRSVAIGSSKSSPRSGPAVPAKLSPRRLGVLKAHSPSAKAVAFSPDGKWLASTNGKEVKVSDVKTLAVLKESKIDDVEALAFSPSGKEVVLCSLRQSVWNLRTNRTRELTRAAVKSGAPDPTVRWLNNGQLFHAFGPAITPWDKTGKALDAVRFKQWVSAWNITDDGKLLASADEENEKSVVRLIDTETREENARFPVDGLVTSVAFSNDGALLAVGLGDSDQGSIHLYDVKKGTRLGTIPGKRRVRDMEFVPNSHILIAAQSYPGVVRIWNADKRRMMAEIKPEREQTVNCLTVSPDGAMLAIGRDDGHVELWAPQ